MVCNDDRRCTGLYSCIGIAASVSLFPFIGVEVAAITAKLALKVVGGHPAVDQQRGPGDELGLIAGVEDGRGGDVTGLADPADRRDRPVVAGVAAAQSKGP